MGQTIVVEGVGVKTSEGLTINPVTAEQAAAAQAQQAQAAQAEQK
jgi:hypothetical protein